MVRGEPQRTCGLFPLNRPEERAVHAVGDNDCICAAVPPGDIIGDPVAHGHDTCGAGAVEPFTHPCESHQNARPTLCGQVLLNDPIQLDDMGDAEEDRCAGGSDTKRGIAGVKHVGGGSVEVAQQSDEESCLEDEKADDGKR